MADALEATVGLIPVALATGLATETIKNINSKPKTVKVKPKEGYKFDKNFKNLFLDDWWNQDQDSYDEAYKECNQDGNQMMHWLYLNDYSLYERMHDWIMRTKYPGEVIRLTEG